MELPLHPILSQHKPFVQEPARIEIHIAETEAELVVFKRRKRIFLVAKLDEILHLLGTPTTSQRGQYWESIMTNGYVAYPSYKEAVFAAGEAHRQWDGTPVYFVTLTMKRL